MRELPAGLDAVLLDFTDEADPATAVHRSAAALRAAIDAGGLTGVTDVVPTGRTVLVQAEVGDGIDTLGVYRALRSVGTASSAADDAAREPVRIPVTYDGEDLSDVAGVIGLSVSEVVEVHVGTVWQVQFMGFAPGFGYLVPLEDADNPLMRVGRRDESRPRVPAGAVAIAAGYSAVYPRQSPGGWQLLGHTDLRLWDQSEDPPALLSPGALVRFFDAGEDGVESS